MKSVKKSILNFQILPFQKKNLDVKNDRISVNRVQYCVNNDKKNNEKEKQVQQRLRK